MDPIERMLQLLAAVSKDDYRETGQAARDLLGRLDQCRVVPMASGENVPISLEQVLRLRSILRQLAGRFAEEDVKRSLQPELLAVVSKMNRVAEEIGGHGLVDLADDLRLQTGSGLVALAVKKPE